VIIDAPSPVIPGASATQCLAQLRRKFGLVVRLRDKPDQRQDAFGVAVIRAVAGGENNRNFRSADHQFPRQVEPAQFAGHDDVGKNQIDVQPGRQFFQRQVRARGFDDPVPEILKHRAGDRPDGGVIFHHQHGFAAGIQQSCRLGIRLFPRLLILGDRKIDRDAGAMARPALDCHMAAGLLGEPVHHRQTQPGAFAGLLG
jgi:hypothetical protein